MNEPQQRDTFLIRWVEKALGSLANASYTRPWITLGLVALLTFASLQIARGLRVDTDLAGLLPSSFESVQNLETLKKRFGGGGYVVVLARGAEPDKLERFAAELTPKLEALEEVRYVDSKKPNAFFQDRALLYMEAEDLKTFNTRLRDRVEWERKHNNPLFVDLENKPRPVLDFSDLEEKYRNRAGGLLPDENDATASAYHLDPEKRMIALLIKPARLSSDLAYSRKIVSQVQEVVSGVDTSSLGADFRVDITGRYKKKIDQQKRIEADLGIATMVALGLMLLYLAFHFRRSAAVGLVLAPLILGLIWTFAAAELIFDQLNILTAFIGSILLGLGIDHGIHLLSRFEVERSRKDAREALSLTFEHTGRAVVIAALTTMVAFLGVAVSEFRAFREFGVIAASGMVLLVLSYTVVLPALLGVAEMVKWKPRETQQSHASSYGRALARWSPALFWGIAVAATLLATNMGTARFNYDFAALEDSNLPSFKQDREVNELLGRSQTPMVVATETKEQESQIVEALRERQKALGDKSSIDFVASMDDLVPPNQEARLVVLKDIQYTLSRVKPKWLDDKDKPRFERLSRMANATGFQRSDLPIELRRNFQGPNPKGDEGVVLIFPSVSLSDGESILKLAQEVKDLPLGPNETISAAGEAMVLADILGMVFQESPIVLMITLIFVFLTLWGLLGNLRKAVIALLPALATLLALVGALPLVDLKLNYLNIIMIPVLFGIAVDGGVHLSMILHGDESDREKIEALEETARAIAGAILTTGLGFGALTLADHPGLNSLGTLALLGLGINLLVCLLGQAALLKLLHSPREHDQAPLQEKIATWISTVGAAGYTPVGSGTVGALVALPMAWGLSFAPFWVRLLVAIVLTAGSVIAVQIYLADDPSKDPSEVVIDELVGCLIALIVVPWGIGWALLGFGLFRLMDIWKPWPIRLFDRHIHGGVGVMGDDVLAGITAAALLFGVYTLI